MMHRIIGMLIVMVWALTPAVHAQTAADSAAIKQAALDYIEGWYEGNAERMERAVHPDLAKRIVISRPDTGSVLRNMTAAQLIDGVRQGFGKRTPKEKQLKDVRILDIFRNTAAARIDASDWIDYLHLARFNDRWVIINVLWELKQR